MTVVPAEVDAREFRRVFGHFCTGVTVITTVGPAGFACQAFAPLSLDPPLVLFCVRAGSRTWRRIRQAGLFGVNVLAEDDHELSRAFGVPGTDRFDGVAWSPSPSGAPILHAALTWAECEVEAVHPGGDHLIVVGRVRTLGECRDGGPLLFFKGRYRSAAPPAPSAGTEVVDTLLAWPRHTDWI
ncbi:3-hydroxy-9,10-secoandrosta-1,3,5(10)-triene-9,17-dione monooxygenase reductase component [Actinoplanes octamycinicus]|uniref:3-hydroxy-9,10-secoandrosta-1,3,5(10)-triene-9, 17-dione monooxygenase reductase component n=1 Tax=Actinoplanes octamycinicus TaxID=135948 RepID=A0A7W7MD02_9ACTN|nr:3-hydroxy-9,10-secoandrosta-1,3,5(10)-triene-9,17-dione monooxygenase reductase subunit [Actinoplanes octamycinicus]MBB4745230.1 3-hydroxy-9,10-secoandrosta-1,3,5(10)-triene-9,17-dione monooxygenase reductase component [Actinoplanes octamycinicus]